MSEQLRLERHLPGVLEDLYLSATPDYRDEVLATVARTRQRPAWTFPERWLPMVDFATRPAFAPRVPLRLLLVVLALLLAAAVAVVAYVGTQRKAPAPYGLAQNGRVVYALDGDLFLGDPATGTSSMLLAGPELDRKPVVSPDGFRLAFLRGTAEDDLSLAVVGTDGGGLKVIEAGGVGFDDSLTWAPNGAALLRTDAAARIIRYDLASGERATVAYGAILQPDAFRPPDGAQLLFESTTVGRSLWLMNADGTGATKVYEIPASEVHDGCDFGTVRWSPDGSRIAFLRDPAGGSDECRLFVMNADGSNARQLTTTPGQWFETDFRWSPDGTQLAFDRWQGPSWIIRPLGLVSANGGEVRSIGEAPVSDGAAFEWSPDGRTIIAVGGPAVGFAQPGAEQSFRPVLIDVATGSSREADWSIASWPSWQRLAAP